MNFRVILVLFFLPILFGCSKNNSPLEEKANLKAELLLSPFNHYVDKAFHQNVTSKLNGNAVTREIWIRNSGTITFIPNSPDCDPYIQVLIQGQGNATHLGLFTIEISYCSDGVNPVGPILGVQTAANGDQLLTALVGAGYDEDLGNYMDFIYYGGTGRFVDASGAVRLYGLVDYYNQVFELQGSGTLTF